MFTLSRPLNDKILMLQKDVDSSSQNVTFFKASHDGASRI